MFRGLTIAGMILVNCPGNDHPFAFLAHADWDGWTFADLIFPAFLVIMGVSLTFSAGRRLEQGASRGQVLAQTARRSVIIFLLGLVTSLVMMPRLHVFRVPGVLQRIAVCNLVCAALVLYLPPRGQFAAGFALVVAYCLITLLIPVPGFGAGDLSQRGNVASYFDRLVFGAHMWHERDDPEGIISTLPAIASALMGALAGQSLRSRAAQAKKELALAAWGAVAIVLGLICSHWIPINKNLWSSSFALFTGGIALLALAGCHWLIESRGVTAWGRPFEVFGKNALAAYFGSELFYGLQEFIPAGRDRNLKEWLDATLFGALSPPVSALAYSACYMLFCFWVMRQLDRRKIYIKV